METKEKNIELQNKPYNDMVEAMTDFKNFLHFFLGQGMSLEELDFWARRLQKKYNFKEKK